MDLLAALIEAVQADVDVVGHGVETIFWPAGGLPARVPPGGEPPERIFIGSDAGAIATRVWWAPEPDLPTEPCWAIVVVEREREAFVAVGPYRGTWYTIQIADLPWFLASTAGSIRSSIEQGEPLVPKRATDQRLFGRVRDGNPPPEDEQGRI